MKRFSRNFLIVGVLLVIMILLCSCAQETNYESFFIEKADSELVSIKYGGQGLLGYWNAIGYMNVSDIECFENNTLTGNVKIYHPYKEDDYMLINVSEIVSIKIWSAEKFYKKYPPYRYN